MKLCKHANYTTINWIKSPKWSTNEVLIDKREIDQAENLILLEFTDPSPQKKYGWLVFDKKTSQESKTQKNGRITVYCVMLSKAKRLEKVTDCDCDNQKLSL